jgi:hypothetical protein
VSSGCRVVLQFVNGLKHLLLILEQELVSMHVSSSLIQPHIEDFLGELEVVP